MANFAVYKRTRHDKDQIIPPTSSHQGILLILDSFRLPRNRLFLSGHRIPCLHLHGGTRCVCHKTRTLVVRKRLSARQYVRQVAGQVFAPSPDSEVCPHLRIPALHGAVHLLHVRHSDVFCLGRLERHGQSVLEHNTYDHDSRRCPILYICAENLVLVLSDGNIVIVGVAEEACVPRRFQTGGSYRHLHHQVQELRPGMPHAVGALCYQRSGKRPSSPRLHQMRTMHYAMSRKSNYTRKIRQPIIES